MEYLMAYIFLTIGSILFDFLAFDCEQILSPVQTVEIKYFVMQLSQFQENFPILSIPLFFIDQADRRYDL